MKKDQLLQALYNPTPAVSLAFFRVIFGTLMVTGLIRFWIKGWIAEFYIKPTYFFTYEGFEWIKPFSDSGMYVLFAFLIVLALFIALGFLYRISIILFFLSFTYVELIDKTNYLNHYYLISLLSFLMIFLPMHCCFSLDSKIKPSLRNLNVPKWTIWSIQLQVGLVYFFGGIAKLKYDWLFQAQPVHLWFSPHTDFPFIGVLMNKLWFSYFVSWLAAFFDLTVIFFLWKDRTRNYAFAVILLFHILTWKLFPIGMFPWMMIFFVLIFYPYNIHQKNFDRILFFISKHSITDMQQHFKTNPKLSIRPIVFVGLFFLIQFLLPFRHLVYSGNVCWTEEGFRFSWNIMLIEKKGHTEFWVSDPTTNKKWAISNKAYLTPLQEFMMSTQPDMILQFAHYLCEKEKEKGIKNPEIRARSFVSLNGRPSCQLIDPNVNLCEEHFNFVHKNWIMPLCIE